VREGGVLVFISEFIFRGAGSWSWLGSVGDQRVRLRRVFRLKRAPTFETSEGRKMPPRVSCARRAGVTPLRLK
jgi:hypothetical protein